MAGGINHPHAIYNSTFNWGYPMNLYNTYITGVFPMVGWKLGPVVYNPHITHIGLLCIYYI